MLFLRAAGPRRAAGGAWVATTVATVASTYALDGFAVAIGGLLVTSGILAGLPAGPLCGCLLASYLLWGSSLRLSLAANWSMLAATGVSSNAFSKAAHDLARARGASARRRRLAASAGYVLTEIAKELPYYLGAAGAALASDSLTSGDALIFLAGTNVGAAAYEYALARATRAFLRPGSHCQEDRVQRGKVDSDLRQTTAGAFASGTRPQWHATPARRRGLSTASPEDIFPGRSSSGEAV